MNNIEKLKQVENLMRYYSEGSRNRVLNRIAGKITDEIFKEVCEEYNICYVCGKELESGKFNIRKRYPDNNWMHQVKSSVCPNDRCQYNTDQASKLQNEEDLKGALYG